MTHSFYLELKIHGRRNRKELQVRWNYFRKPFGLRSTEVQEKQARASHSQSLSLSFTTSPHCTSRTGSTGCLTCYLLCFMSLQTFQ